MGDDNNSALVSGQMILQPEQGLEVQVVGRFVQDEQLGLAEQKPCQRQTGLFTAGEGVDGGVQILVRKTHTVENGLDFDIHQIAFIGFKIALQLVIPGRQLLVLGGIVRTVAQIQLKVVHFLPGFQHRCKDPPHLLNNGILA